MANRKYDIWNYIRTITLIIILLIISKDLWCEGFNATVLTRKGHLNIRGILVLTKSHMGSLSYETNNSTTIHSVIHF
ncbi:unnamed protein product [Adineta ricciae]|uniref:Uncharacterized protein n=1 Tax=Adineta ricciae TaxID=249248 RepID=A0A814VAI4_ADIRI|nr:unnamed protein product [Adineta ricciae]